MEWKSPRGGILKLVTGDITKFPADAIVNAANSYLQGGGGVDGAIHGAGGPSIMKELDDVRARIGRCPTGDAVVTGAGNLPAKYVFHAVGPVYRDGRHGEPELLAGCYRTCLKLALQCRVSTITFPSISTGAYGYPMSQAAEIAIREVTAFMKSGSAEDEDTSHRQPGENKDIAGGPSAEPLKSGYAGVSEVIFVLFDERAYNIYAAAVERVDEPQF